MLHFSRSQLNQIADAQFRARLDAAMRRTVPEYAGASPALRDEFVLLALDCAGAARLVTEQGIAAYALGAWYIEPEFEHRSRLLLALLKTTLPEFRKVHAMNEWLHAVIGNPSDVESADMALRKSFDATRAWGV